MTDIAAVPRQVLTDCGRQQQLIWTRILPDGPGLHSPKLDGDVGWDLEAAENVLLSCHEQRDIHTNVRAKLPPDCWGEIRARSSIARLGLSVEPCVIDNGYTGELLVLVRNVNQGPQVYTDWLGRVQVRVGMRIAQLVLHQGVWISGQEVPGLEHDPRRGAAGFGSTNGL